MTRYRIVEKRTKSHPNRLFYDVEKRGFLWWNTVSSDWSSIEGAKLELFKMIKEALIDFRPKIVKEYEV